ncbi:ArsR/SmtB family transcription factor [Ligilactobacillus acidipiscis]|uniref:ArsR/SmtB family transcription factor n=1 Tax=Ligilactobacillus acidipiscis TaxID=89059 RepID=UPI0022E909E9|nr:metalloregulator ArsR/SmtB family transcription factor [Ligilactobacillus acidipiscis]
MPNYSNLKQDLEEVSDFLLALGNENRQAIIIRLLEENSCTGIQIDKLTAATNLSRPAISHHLKVLKDAKIVDYHKNGTKNFYYLKHDVSEITKLQDFLTKVTKIMTKEQKQ